MTRPDSPSDRPACFAEDVSSKDSAEAAAFHYVPAILGVQLEPWDNCGRQGAVDALLHYSDGRIAALEVTSIAAEGRRQLYSLLNANQVLPNPGRWSWSASIDDPRDFPEFQRRAGDIVTKSEALGITHPEHAYHEAFQGDPDFDWIVRSSVTMSGSPTVPKIREEDGAERPFWVTHGGSGGAVDESLAGFAEALDEVLTIEHIRKRVEKLRRDGRAQQHLFIAVDESALPFSVAYALMARDLTPPGLPTLPGDVTHLWILVPYSAWVLLGTREGWARYSREDLSAAT